MTADVLLRALLTTHPGEPVPEDVIDRADRFEVPDCIPSRPCAAKPLPFPVWNEPYPWMGDEDCDG